MAHDESTDSGRQGPPSEVERLFAEFLLARDSVAFDTFAARHAEHESDLRRIYEGMKPFLGPAGPDAEATIPGLRDWLAPETGESAGRERFSSGQVVGGYRLDRRIGRGGMGVVWLATELALGRPVALKFLKGGFDPDEDRLTLLREAKAGGRLTHPGLVTIYGQGESDGLAWIAMEFVPGDDDLARLIEEVRGLDELPPDYYPGIAQLFERIARAMQAAHEAGVIHRDLKPANILLTPSDEPKITDFGLARLADDSATVGGIAGTAAYMSPEQASPSRGEPSARSDVFSLGAILYEFLALRRAFEGDSIPQILRRVLEEDPPDPRRLRSRVPADLALVCLKALEKEPARRYPSMEAFAEDLRRFQAHEPVEAAPPGPARRALKWCRRHPTLSSLAALASAALVVISGLLWQNVVARDDAERNAVEAEQNAQLYRAERNAVLRLSAVRDLDDLRRRAREAWPAVPARVDDYRDWLAQAERVTAGLEPDPATGDPGHLAQLERVRARGRLSDAGEWVFDETEDAWWHRELERLIRDIRELNDPETGPRTGTSPEYGPGVEWRLDTASTVEARTLTSPDARAAWSEATASIADPKQCPAYRGLTIEPQLGLWPLRRNEETGLWEFWHVTSGERPRLDEDGRWIVAAGTGIVLVLLPGGETPLGTQMCCPDGPRFVNPDRYSDDLLQVLTEEDERLSSNIATDSHPVSMVRLSPFFVSVFETTQGQWVRTHGTNPSQYPDGFEYRSWTIDAMHPVENVSWLDARVFAERQGVRLPTEAEWEYAIAALSDTIWSYGDESSRVHLYANVMDITHQKAMGKSMKWYNVPGEDGTFAPVPSDGNVLNAMVGTYLPNDFGIYDGHGNVWEWCEDAYSPTAYSEYDGQTDPLSDPSRSHLRVIRGGSSQANWWLARTANRYFWSHDTSDSDIGFRVTRSVDGLE